MRRLVVLLIALMTAPATAQTARVISGDHDGFSRLVVELPSPSDWTLGRTADGYALSVATSPAGYDLSGVFDLIRRNRLAAVSVDPATGNLQFGLACACHAIPFEFRPGVIVIDIREGPPPEGSSFEEPINTTGKSAALIPDTMAVEPAATTGTEAVATDPASATDASPPSGPAKPGRWIFSPMPQDNPLLPGFAADAGAVLPPLDEAIGADGPPAPGTASGMAPASAPMTALRDDLLLQISRGAAEGVVDLAPGSDGGRADADEPATPGFAQVEVDPVPGLAATTVSDPDAALTADGATCIADDRLDVADWGMDGPVAGNLASLTTGLVGEFDIVNSEAVGNAIRYTLYLGFGAEASRLIQVFPTSELAADAPVWDSMARVIDGYPDAEGVFARMQNCDTGAALWAVLSRESLANGEDINTAAALRGFSALPLHLRLTLGPGLAARFMDIGRDDVAQTVRDAIARAPEGAGHEADLISASLDLARGDAEGAQVMAARVIEDAGPGVAEAMLTLVGSTLAQGKAVDGPTVDALAALLRENQGAPLEPALTDALILSLASGGNADAAFARLPEHPDSEAALWAAMARSGSDNDVLKHAIRPRAEMPTDAPPEARARIAERLARLGFPQEAALWQAGRGENDELVAAEARPVHDTVAIDPATREEQARIAARDWTGLAVAASPPWQSAARHVVAGPDQAVPQPPLAQAAALLETAAATRTDIEALLAAVAKPDSPPAPE